MESAPAVAMVIVIVVLMVAVFIGVLIGMSQLFAKSATDQVNIQQFQAGLVKHLPPDVQMEINRKQQGTVAFLAISIIALPSILVGLVLSGNGNHSIVVGCGFVLAMACAGWLVAIIGTVVQRRNPGKIYADLSPHPVARSIRRNAWLTWGFCVFMVATTVMSMVTSRQWLFLTAQLVLVLLLLLGILLHSDRVWLAERGLFTGGRLRPWHAFDRVEWTDKGRAFALRGKGRWLSGRWTLVPVPEGAREVAERGLLQLMPAAIPTG